MADELHPAARAIRAARAYAGMSRMQLGQLVGVSAETIGRWERGQWREGPPRPPMLEAIARASGLLDFVAAIQAEAQEPDPARRFAAATRQEAERRNGHHASGPASRSDADAGSAAP